jgi:hypothetical protein
VGEEVAGREAEIKKLRSQHLRPHVDSFFAWAEQERALYKDQRGYADFQRFFGVTAPSVHQMIVQLERLGFIRRTRRQARSIELLVPPDQLPALQPINMPVARY